jgi:hypothetical protein
MFAFACVLDIFFDGKMGKKQLFLKDHANPSVLGLYKSRRVLPGALGRLDPSPHGMLGRNESCEAIEQR